MKLISIAIHNFRGILDMKIEVGDFSLLVGPNNSGKSSVIDAIRALYEKEGFKFVHERDFPKLRTEDADSWIEIVCQLTSDENEKLPKDLRRKDKRVKLRRWFHSENEVSTGWKSGKSYFYDPDFKTLSRSIITNAKGTGFSLGHLVYIPALSRVDDHLRLNGPSAMRDLMRLAVDSDSSSPTKKAKTSKAIEHLSNSLFGGARKRTSIFSSIEEELKENLGPWGVSFKFSVRNHETEALMRALFGWELVDSSSNSEIAISQFGSGFQRHFTASLIQLVAKLANGKKGKSIRKDSTPNTLLLFEEPEAFLHPTQQTLLATSLRKIGDTDGMQVVCTTHSPKFVSPRGDELSSIIKLSRMNGTSVAHQLSRKSWKELINSAMKLREAIPSQGQNTLSDEAAKQILALKNSSWLRSGRNEFLFSDEVLLVEGETERAFITQLIDDGKFRLSSGRNLYILDCLGKFNIPSFMNLLSAFGLKHYVLFDCDGNKPNHKSINDEIKNAGKENELTAGVSYFPVDLEKYLGITRTGRQNDKPLQLLFDYREGRIKKKKLSAFFRKLERLLEI